MGQPIEVESDVVDDVLLLDTDRSVTGQDGTSYGSLEEAQADERFPGKLASRLFDEDPAINHIFAGSNTVVVRRNDGWTDEEIDRATDVVRDFFLHYRE